MTPRGGRSARARRSRARPPSAARASCRGSAPRSSARSRAASTPASSCATCSPRPPAQRVQTLAKLGVGVVLLDECHHLASLWGYVVRAVLGELPEDAHVIGLTATPPVSLPSAEAELYDALLGPVDFTVPTPAVVRDGHLAPYQELALADRAADRRARLAGRARHPLPRADHDAARRRRVPRSGCIVAPARPPPLGRRRRRAVVGGVPEAQPEARPRRRALPALGRPAAAARRAPRRGLPPAARPRGLARAARGLRAALPGAAGLARGVGALRRDRRRAARARLPAHPQGHPPRHVGGRPAADRLAGQGARARRGARRARHETRGDALRGLVLCDAELAAQRPDDALTGVLDPAAGTARHALLAIAADDRTAPDAPAAGLRPRPALRARTTPRCCSRRCARRPRSASRCPSGRPSRTAC